MSGPDPEQFRTFVEEIVAPITAGQRRKVRMRQELLAHLNESFQRELARSIDAQSAADTSIRSFGDPTELRDQLQAAVPLWEHTFHCFINQKETPMSRVLWGLSIVAILIGNLGSFTYREDVYMSGVALLSVMIIRHLYREQNLARRWLGQPRQWLAGAFGIAFGPALVLPALAKIKMTGLHEPAIYIALATGALITLSGVGLVIRHVMSRRVQAA